MPDKLISFMIDRDALREIVREVLPEILDELPPHKEVYSEAEFCKLAGISKDTAKKLRDRGELKFKQAGRRILYSRKHISDFLNSNAS
jgi:hypothetical protein